MKYTNKCLLIGRNWSSNFNFRFFRFWCFDWICTTVVTCHFKNVLDVVWFHSRVAGQLWYSEKHLLVFDNNIQFLRLRGSNYSKRLLKWFVNNVQRETDLKRVRSDRYSVKIDNRYFAFVARFKTISVFHFPE